MSISFVSVMASHFESLGLLIKITAPLSVRVSIFICMNYMAMDIILYRPFCIEIIGFILLYIYFMSNVTQYFIKDVL